jgi:hypothetical protein
MIRRMPDVQRVTRSIAAHSPAHLHSRDERAK